MKHSREIMIEDALNSASLRILVVGLNQRVPSLPPTVHADWWDVSRCMIAQSCAGRECALADGAGTRQLSWDALATGLIDAVVGLWQAPVTTR